MSKNKVALIDADILVYQAASSVEREYDWGDGVWTVHADENLGIKKFDEKVEQIMDTAGADIAYLALSDALNFRRDVLPTYKSNRKDTRKPLLWGRLRDYAHEEYSVFQRPKLEGDDILGILATAKGLIEGDKFIVTLDKDLKQIPGKHFRMKTPDDGIIEVSPGEADHFFYLQALMGDATDGYSGCPGIGIKKAEAILKKAEEAGEPLWPVIVEAYEKAGLGEEAALQQARVARILRATDYNFKKKEPILWKPQ